MDNFYINLVIWAVVIGATFGYLWHKGHLVRLSNYVRETREELKKCAWPTWDELKGNTAVVMVAMLLLGVFTMSVDFLLALMVRTLAQ